MSIKGNEYLAFMADKAFWRPAKHADTQGVHAGNVSLIVDGHQIDGEDLTPEAIAPDSTVTILFGEVFEDFERLHTLQEHFDAWKEHRAGLDLMKLRHDAFNERLRKRGVKLVEYKVPCCGDTVETSPAPAGAKWDSLAVCTACGTMYMKITTGDKVQALLPPSAEDDAQ